MDEVVDVEEVWVRRNPLPQSWHGEFKMGWTAEKS